MMNSFKKIVGLCLLLAAAFMQGQGTKLTAIQVVKKATLEMSKQDYLSYETKYTLYLDYKTTHVHEQYFGRILKKNNVNYFKIKNTEFVSFQNYGLKINHDEKALIVEKKTNESNDSPLSIENYLKGYDSKLIQSNPLYFICEFTPSKLTQIMMSKVVLYIKKTDYSIAKQELFLSENMESKDAKGKTIYTTPRLEIVLSPKAKDEKRDTPLVTKDNYFTEKKNEILISKRLAAYQLFKS